MSPLTLALLPVTACASALVATRLLIGFLRRRQILDQPNDRSSHETPTPRGGGAAVLLVTLTLWAAAAAGEPELLSLRWPLASVATGALMLAAISWIDDIRGLGPLPRLFVQAAGVALGLSALPHESLVLQGLAPSWLDRLIAGIGWLWFVNLYNFMDGIDGIAASETACIGVGLAVVGLLGAAALGPGLLGLILAGAALGFLRWNWQPARVFLGDVGSVPIGFITGWLLLLTAAQGAWSVALLLPLYFLGDATVTLFRRLLRGEQFWRAHREHYYQRAVRRGLGHARVVGAVLACNVVLIALAFAAAVGPDWITWAALLGGAVVTFVLLLWMGGGRPTDDPEQGSAR